MGFKRFLDKIKLFPPERRQQLVVDQSSPSDYRVIILDGKNLVWQLTEEVEVLRAVLTGMAPPPARAGASPEQRLRVREAQAVHAHHARMMTQGEPAMILLACRRLVAYLRAHGLEPWLVVDRFGDEEAAGVKRNAKAAANTNSSSNKGTQTGTHPVERFLAQRATAGEDYAPESAYLSKLTEPRLAVVEGLIIDAFELDGWPVSAVYGETDLLWESLAARLGADAGAAADAAAGGGGSGKGAGAQPTATSTAQAGRISVMTGDSDAIAVRGPAGFARMVMPGWVPWHQLLTAPVDADHNEVGRSVAASNPLRYIDGELFSVWVAESVPGFVSALLPELAQLCGTDYTKDTAGLRAVHTHAAVFNGRGLPREFNDCAQWAVDRLLLRHDGHTIAVLPFERYLEDKGVPVAPELAEAMAYSRRRLRGEVRPLEDTLNMLNAPQHLLEGLTDDVTAGVHWLWRGFYCAGLPTALTSAPALGGCCRIPIDASNFALLGLKGIDIGRDRLEAPIDWDATQGYGPSTPLFTRPLSSAELRLFQPDPSLLSSLPLPVQEAARLLFACPKPHLHRVTLRCKQPQPGGKLEDKEGYLVVCRPPPDEDDAAAVAAAVSSDSSSRNGNGGGAGAFPDADAGGGDGLNGLSAALAAMGLNDHTPEAAARLLTSLLPIGRLRCAAGVQAAAARDAVFAAASDEIALRPRRAYLLPAVLLPPTHAANTGVPQDIADAAAAAMSDVFPPLIRPPASAAGLAADLFAPARQKAAAGDVAGARREVAKVVVGRALRVILSVTALHHRHAASAAGADAAAAAAALLPTLPELAARAATAAALIAEDEHTNGRGIGVQPVGHPSRPALGCIRQANLASYAQQIEQLLVELLCDIGVCEDNVTVRSPGSTTGSPPDADVMSSTAYALHYRLPRVPAWLLFDGARYLRLYQAFIVPHNNQTRIAPPASPEGYHEVPHPSRGVAWSPSSATTGAGTGTGAGAVALRANDGESGGAIPEPAQGLLSALRSALPNTSDANLEAAAVNYRSIWDIALAGGLESVARNAYAAIASAAAGSAQRFTCLPTEACRNWRDGCFNPLPFNAVPPALCGRCAQQEHRRRHHHHQMQQPMHHGARGGDQNRQHHSHQQQHQRPAHNNQGNFQHNGRGGNGGSRGGRGGW